MPRLPQIRDRVGRHSPAQAQRGDLWFEAAVSLILREPSGRPPEILFIERAERTGDPWSGQMAFPGGRRDRSDPDLEATAIRETLEEVGLELGTPIGRLDEIDGARGQQRRRLVVAPYVFEIDDVAVPEPGPEVQEAVWIPVDHLLDPESFVRYRFEREEGSGTFPGIRFDRHVVWGLTYRILSRFFEILGRELPGSRG